MIKNEIRKIFAIETEEGAGAKVRRLFPTHYLSYIDPFVLLDEFFLDPSAGFPAHPHRGFEVITYMLEGAFRHKDNFGNKTEVLPGGIQHFSSGRGLIHSEMPGEQPLSHGLQLWINLPKKLKGSEPYYQQVDAGKLPETNTNGVKIRTIVGEGSPVKLYTPVLYQVIEMNNASTSINVPNNFEGFIYVYKGKLSANERFINPGEGLLLKRAENLTLKSSSLSGFIFAAGQPHNEPVYMHGSFVD